MHVLLALDLYNSSIITNTIVSVVKEMIDFRFLYYTRVSLVEEIIFSS